MRFQLVTTQYKGSFVTPDHCLKIHSLMLPLCDVSEHDQEVWRVQVPLRPEPGGGARGDVQSAGDSSVLAECYYCHGSSKLISPCCSWPSPRSCSSPPPRAACSTPRPRPASAARCPPSPRPRQPPGQSAGAGTPDTAPARRSRYISVSIHLSRFSSILAH